ncbi:AAA family ATPase [Nocardia farcinica]|uniref:AAA family ATPase n=1 Tax=Nocardia farcinica TaxID=37329 RepID=UPI00245471C7|nr:AAA family ATPase [Nocardia farcinica]
MTDIRASSIPRGDAGGVRLPAPTAHCYDHTVYDQFCHVCRECYRIQLEEEREQQQPATPAADHFADADNMIPAPWPGPAEYEPPPDEPDRETSGSGRRLVVTRGSDVRTKRVRWVDPDWMPAGSLVLLAGREGLGKSTIAAEKAARVTRGQLEGEWFGRPRNVLYLHTEDAREFTVVPRLRAAGADMDRVLFVDVHTELTNTGTLILPADILGLDQLVVAEEVSFIVLDAATSAMSSELSGKDDRQVRQFLEPLAQLAARRDCVVLGLCHFGKRDGADTGKLILGSIAWSQVARSVLSVAKDEDSGNLVVTNTKGNLAPRTRSMEAVIESATVPTDDGVAEVGLLRWLGESDRDARDLLSGEGAPDSEDRTAAEAWLEDYLTEQGSTPAKVVKAEARKQGFSDATVKRAAKSIGVAYAITGFPRTSVWTLQSAQSDQGSPTHEPTEPTEPTGPDQRKRSEPTEPNPQSAQAHVNEPTVNPLHAEVRTPGRKPGQWLGSGEPVATVTPLTASRDTERHSPRAPRRTRGGRPVDRGAS